MSVKFVCVDCSEIFEAASIEDIALREKRCGYCYSCYIQSKRSGLRDLQLRKEKVIHVDDKHKLKHIFICSNCGTSTKPLSVPPHKCPECFKKAFKKQKECVHVII